MSNITAALVAELRNRTGAGMMDCKKALVEAFGDIELAIENMRKSGQAKAAKKAGNIAAEGVILVRINDAKTEGYLVEVNCQTDFVAKDSGFLEFANKVADYLLANNVSLADLNAHFDEERAQLIAKIGENITIRRFEKLTGNNLGFYLHGSKIGVIVDLSVNDEQVSKNMAMHVAASKPEYVDPADIPADVLANEKRIQGEMMAAEEEKSDKKKAPEMLEKILEGKINKFAVSISLNKQDFIINTEQKVEAYLKSVSNKVVAFTRIEVGEGIEKKEVDFAAEVAAMTGK